MNRSSKVSVVIPCFNHGEFLPEAVTSIAAVKRDDVELIVVDDGSTDERTARRWTSWWHRELRSFGKKTKGWLQRGTQAYWRPKESIFSLDADDRLRPGWMDRGIRILDSDPKVGIVYGEAQCFGIRAGLW
jgi:cellulose synthase/poly-beta-1,6-N-acetylglucosamine synthase-like glycosyltransferase